MIKKEINCDRCTQRDYINTDEFDFDEVVLTGYHTIWIKDNTIDTHLCPKCYESFTSWLSND